MRKYTKGDCIVQTVQKDQELSIGEACIPANAGGECDLVLMFGYPDTEESVYVPSNSKIEIDGRLYKVLEIGLDCLLDEEGKTHSMDDFRGRKVKIVELPKSRFRGLLRHLFNKDYQN